MPKAPKDPQKIHAAVTAACEALLLNSAAQLITSSREGAFILTQLLDELVWKYSEATSLGCHKYLSCEWWSENALEMFYREGRNYVKYINLEHVVPRRYIVQQLLKSTNREEIERAFKEVVTCVVLREEHRKLPEPQCIPNDASPEWWWQRYACVRRKRLNEPLKHSRIKKSTNKRVSRDSGNLNLGGNR